MCESILAMADHHENDALALARARTVASLEAERGTTTDAARLAVIEHALERIAHGKFGICEVCGGTISLLRLSKDPTLAACSDCRTPAPPAGALS